VPPADAPARAQPAAATATVLKAVDGDTVDIRDDQRGRLRIRLLGMDAPEVHRAGWSVGCWGPEAARYAQDMLVGKRVLVVPDPTQTESTATAARWPTSISRMDGTSR
jgi:micrococcal nuclease